MRLLHSPFLSQSLIKLSHLPLRNAAFRPRTFSVRPDRIRASKSLIDDEAELSKWVDDLRTGRETPETTTPGSGPGKDNGFRSRKSSAVSRGSGLGERRGGDFRKGKPSLNSKRRFPVRSDSSDVEDEVVDGGKFKGGGGSGYGSIGKFISEDETEDEIEGEESDEEIVEKSRSVLFGKKVSGLSTPTTTTRPASSGGTDSYLSESRCVCLS